MEWVIFLGRLLVLFLVGFAAWFCLQGVWYAFWSLFYKWWIRRYDQEALAYLKVWVKNDPDLTDEDRQFWKQVERDIEARLK